MTRDLKTAILIEGLDDWVPLRDVDRVAMRLYPELDAAGRRELIIEAIRQMVDERLAEAGTVAEKAGYVALGGTALTAVNRVRDALLEDDPNMWGYAVWLNNTPAGDVVARQAESPPQES